MLVSEPVIGTFFQKPAGGTSMISIHRHSEKRRRIPLTPLIDVIFILVMFFLLSSTFGVWRPLDIALGRAGQGGQPDQQTTKPAVAPVLIQVRSDAETGSVRITVNGIGLTIDVLATQLDKLAERGAREAVLAPARGTKFQQVVHVLDEARLSRIKRISLKLD